MTEKKKTEVNLEMCSGFFRIPTDEIIYNITVLASNEPSTTKVVEKIIEVEKIVEVEKKSTRPVAAAPAAVAVEPLPQTDDYFPKCAQRLGQELSTVAREADNQPGGQGGPDLDAIRDLAAMAAELKEVLLAMKGHSLLSATDSSRAQPSSTLARLTTKINEARAFCSGATPLSPTPAAPPAASKTVTRYLFDLDTVFQTIYELCTNETVKGHIKAARDKAAEIFDKELFYDAISPKVSGYPEDDGFLTVPMTDIYTALGSACQDKAIGNLLAKMDKQQAAIFLDQFLPLEVPPREEVTLPLEGSAVETDAPAADDGNGDALSLLLSECQADLDTLIEQSQYPDKDQPPATDDLITKVEDAITITANIHYEAKRLAEEGGNAPGAAPLAPPLGLKIKGLAMLAETMLNDKKAKPSLTYDEGLAAGEAARQSVLAESTPRPAPSPAPAKAAPVKKPPEQDNFGEASQDDIDRLLEELG